MLDALGVAHLVAVAGPSFGGYQAFQWAVTYPDAMHGIVAVGHRAQGPRRARRRWRRCVAQLGADPNWNGGWHYDRGGIPQTMTAHPDGYTPPLREQRDPGRGLSPIPPPARPACARWPAAWAHRVRPELPVDAAPRDGALRRRAASLEEDPRARSLRHLPLGRPLPPLNRPRRDGEAGRGRRATPRTSRSTPSSATSASGADWAKWAPGPRRSSWRASPC